MQLHMRDSCTVCVQFLQLCYVNKEFLLNSGGLRKNPSSSYGLCNEEIYQFFHR